MKKRAGIGGRGFNHLRYKPKQFNNVHSLLHYCVVLHGIEFNLENLNQHCDNISIECYGASVAGTGLSPVDTPIIIIGDLGVTHYSIGPLVNSEIGTLLLILIKLERDFGI